MGNPLCKEFLRSDDTLRVYAGSKLLFSSKKDRLKPLLDYMEWSADAHQAVVMMDRVVGNAAALLMILAGCGEVYSPLGSDLAAKTLQKWGVSYHFDQVVPHIERANGAGMCPMEELSMGKSPAEFYAVMWSRER